MTVNLKMWQDKVERKANVRTKDVHLCWAKRNKKLKYCKSGKIEQTVIVGGVIGVARGSAVWRGSAEDQPHFSVKFAPRQAGDEGSDKAFASQLCVIHINAWVNSSCGKGHACLRTEAVGSLPKFLPSLNSL